MTGFESKILRSEHHLHSLRRAVREYFNTDLQHFALKYDPDAHPRMTERIFFIPQDFALMASDAIVNLRSSVDYLMWDLVLANGAEPTERTQFPLALAPRTEKGQRVPPDVCGEISLAALAEVERLQPYNAGHPSAAAMTPLGMLRELANVTKHRHVPIVTSHVADGATVRIAPGQSWIGDIPFFLVHYMKDGALFSTADADVEVKGQLTVQVSIGPSVPVGPDPPAFPKGYEPLISTLDLLTLEVWRCISALEGFL